MFTIIMNHINDIFTLFLSSLLDFLQHSNYATWIGVFINLLWNFINYRNNKIHNDVRLRLIPTIVTLQNTSVPAWHIINLR